MPKSFKDIDIKKRAEIPQAVITRLPRYYRYLRQLVDKGEYRISSLALSRLMGTTASQIRQDLNYFGGFGQQGYGYNTKNLCECIADILGNNNCYNTVIIGAGNLGRAIATSSSFSHTGLFLKCLFDVKPELVGKTVNGCEIRHLDEMDEFWANNRVDVAILTLPSDAAVKVAHKLAELGIMGIWNFSEVELGLDPEKVAVRDVHLVDSFMTLCFDIKTIENNI
ncbi:MAG: redox-sensing transcriptional repressor Rex [Clostridia bacterium]|nr:redox-sensing transcriptional repressor Rex [Clostridia bacterium]